jgi:hypothetical protein
MGSGTVTGFTVNNANLINQLRRNIKDNYKAGFPIIKELIQNADDGEATSVTIGWSIGIPDNPHPLFQTPGVFVTNNGKFDDRDERGIKSIGVSVKSGDEGTIGKFGLGLKSIFHLGEAFLYIAQQPDGGNGAPDREWVQLISPWVGRDLPWLAEVSPQARASLTQCLQPFLPEGERWFCLWVPLRTSVHALTGRIGEGTPGDPDEPGKSPDVPVNLMPSNGAELVAECLPMLRHVRHVAYVTNHGDGFRQVWEVKLADDAVRTQFHEQVNSRGPWDARLEGDIRIHWGNDGSRSSLVRYAGFESMLGGPTHQGLSELQTADDWPQTAALIDEASATFEDQPEKALPHVAVYWVGVEQSRGSAGSGGANGSFVSQDAVFLPIGTRPSPTSYAGVWSTTLVRHAYQFVDSGRVLVADDQSVRGRWNKYLTEHGVVPLVLESLDIFVKRTNFEIQESKHLTDALIDTDWFKTFKKQVCLKATWCLQVTTKDEVSWGLVPIDKPIIEFPACRGRAEIAFEVFPNLAHEILDVCFMYQDFPRIQGSYKPAVNIPYISRILLSEISIKHIVHSDEHLAFFTDFIEKNKNTIFNNKELRERVLNITRKLFINIEHSQEIEKIKEKIKRLIALIGPKHCWSASIAKALSQAVIEVETSLLFVPQEFDGAVRSEGRLTPDDAGLVVRALAKIVEQAGQARSSEASNAIVKMVAGLPDHDDRDRVIETIRDRPVFPVNELGHSKVGNRSKKSWNVLVDTARRGRVMAQRSGGDDLAKALSEALQDSELLLVDSSLADLLQDVRVHVCTVEACILFLTGARSVGTVVPALASPHDRLRLLDLVLPDKSSSQWSTAVRYLLHGSAPHIGRNDSLFIRSDPDDEQSSRVWMQVARKVLDADPDSHADWIFPPPELIDRVPRADCGQLRIKTMGEVGAVELLKTTDCSLLDFTDMTRTDREFLIETINDDDIIRTLCIHELHEEYGVLISLLDNCVLANPDHQFNTTLRPHIQVIKQCSTERARDRQRKLLAPVDAVSEMDIALRQEHPERYWEEILRGLGELDAARTGLGSVWDADRAKRLRQAASTVEWLPLAKSGQGVAPESVLFVEGLDDTIIDAVLAKHRKNFRTISELNRKLIEHIKFRNVISLTINGDQALHTIGEIAGRQEEYSIGLKIYNEDDLRELVSAFDGQSDPSISFIPLIKACLELTNGAISAQIIATYLSRQINTNRSIHLLNVLNSAYERSTPTERKRIIINIYNKYLLYTCLISNQNNAWLRQIKLLSRSDKWSNTNKLCLDKTTAGIAKDYLLDEKQENILENIISIKSDSVVIPDEYPRRIEIVSHELNVYVEELLDAGAVRELVGCLLALLGDEPSVRSLAENCLGERRTLFGVRESFGIEQSTTQLNKSYWIIPRINNDYKKIEVINILGDRIIVSSEDKSEHLLAGNLEFTERNWVYFITPENRKFKKWIISLKKLTKSESAHEINQKIRSTIGIILEKAYDRHTTQLEQILDEIQKSDQLDIDVARERLIGAAQTYVRNMGTSLDERLLEIFKKIRNIEFSDAEKHAQNQVTDSREIRYALNNLVRVIESDQKINDKLVGALREKIRNDYRYDEKSVLLELFQNADDAVVELEELGDRNRDSDISKMVKIIIDKKSLGLIHWGRMINEDRVRLHGGSRQGYQEDLWKMLSFGISDKRHHKASVTGKFGLGFKSVFLITGEPRVLSGRLAFRIVSGFLPQRLTQEAIGRLQDDLGDAGQGSHLRTVISLPFTLPDSAERARLAVESFVESLPFLLGFSRRITRCVVVDLGQTTSAEWHETRLGVDRSRDVVRSDPAISVGQVSGLSGNVPRLLLLRGGDSGSMAFRLGTRGIERIADEVPSIWVTAPTQERARLGFVMNGPWRLDVGRAQLPIRATENARTARQLGAAVAGQLLELAVACSANWEDVVKQFGLAKDVTPEGFWGSFWQVVGVGLLRRLGDAGSREDVRPVDMAVEALWGDRSVGFGALVSDRQVCVLPSGLSGSFDVLTSLCEITAVTHGLLDEPEVFEYVAESPKLREMYGPRALASGDRLWEPLQRLLLHRARRAPDVTEIGPGRSDEPTKLRLIDLVRNAVADTEVVSYDAASWLGRIVTPAREREWSELRSKHNQEWSSISGELRELHFLASDGSAQLASSLLGFTNEGSDDEERMLASFAPVDARLSPEYDDHAIAFVKACRGNLRLSPTIIADWVRNVSTESGRVAALRYLTQGYTYGSAALRVLAVSGGLDWATRSMLESSGLGPVEQRFLTLVLFPRTNTEEDYIEDEEGYYILIPKIAKKDAKEELEKLYLKCSVKSEAHQISSKHESSWYPNNLTPRFGREDDLSSLETRKRWLTLLVLGACHTFGRTQPEQHRSFLERCDHRGWLDTFASETSSTDEWIDILNEIIETKEYGTSYWYWMRLFPAIYQISVFLNEYIELLRGMDRRKSVISLAQVLSPRNDPELQGGGIRPPSLVDVLGSGAPFVVRELARTRVLTSDNVHRWCFVPRRGVVRFLEELGMQTPRRGCDGSADIHAFLVAHLGDRATFNGLYDLPLEAEATGSADADSDDYDDEM